MLVIGLTGGIGCGKTLVSNYFKSLNVPVIDADIISRKLVTPNSPALKSIVNAFGSSVLYKDQSLNRSALRQVIFNNPDDKKKLEAILHPAIRYEIKQRIKFHSKENYIIVVIPLLFETQQTDLVDRILVIDCPESSQIERVTSRDNISKEDVLRIVRSQFDPTMRLNQADDILVNNSSIETLEEKIRALHKKYEQISNTNQDCSRI